MLSYLSATALLQPFCSPRSTLFRGRVSWTDTNGITSKTRDAAGGARSKVRPARLHLLRHHRLGKIFSKARFAGKWRGCLYLTRNGIEVRYSFSYTFDPNDENENRTLFVRLVEIEFSPSVPLAKIPSLVPEFHPSEDPASPSFRSNIWVLLFKGPASPQARFIVREATRDKLEWTLAYQFFSLQGLPDPLTTKVLVDRVEISTQSIDLVKQRQRHTHDPIMNPYSREFSQQQLSPRPGQVKTIPVPKYAD